MLPTSGGTKEKFGRNFVGNNNADSMIDSFSEVSPVENSPPSNSKFPLHRKLHRYIRMRQAGFLGAPDYTRIAPNRTFALLDIAKRVARRVCPSNFVSDVFINQVMELFVVLHRGQEFRFPEDIESRDFRWIQEILLKCRRGIMKSTLDVRGSESSQPECENSGLVNMQA